MDLTLSEAFETGDDLGALGVRGGNIGSWCCTASYKRVAIAIREVKELHCWHEKQSLVLQEGYNIRERIIADKWVHKSQVAAEDVKDYYSLIMHKNVTFRGLLACHCAPCHAHRQLHCANAEAGQGVR